ncbi:MAG: hypothetical protein JKY67_16850 [Pseudomonadales bacterium]|nr:hypothetical protein [Pseudomonadales bacterium]
MKDYSATNFTATQFLGSFVDRVFVAHEIFGCLIHCQYITHKSPKKSF